MAHEEHVQVVAVSDCVHAREARRALIKPEGAASGGWITFKLLHPRPTFQVDVQPAVGVASTVPQ
eukprot:3314129-Rhodomonas_salina.1